MDRTITNQAPQMSPEDRKGHGHYFISAQAKVRGAVRFCKRMGIEYFKDNIFQIFNIFHCQGYEFLRNDSFLHRLHNNPDLKETRGRRRLISTEKVRKMEHIL